MRILSSEITPLSVYGSRREFMLTLGGTAALGAVGMPNFANAQLAGSALTSVKSSIAGALSLEKQTSFQDATNYNNFYEFSTSKEGVAPLAPALNTANWKVRVEGLVKKPTTYNLEDIMKWSAMEERIYRLRCVEGWSMVIPWIGYSLANFIKKVEPLPSAKYIEFVTQNDPKTMPGLRSGVLDWPYTEGLRMDEAMHPLALLGFGMYGQVMPKQNGAPIRLVVPWKYGFKSAKSIVAIRFTEKQPQTAWNKAGPQEYGFYSNVNPSVPHPRWSQETERRIGEEGGLFAKKRKTLLFNGYEAQVGQLYAGMDLRRFY